MSKDKQIEEMTETINDLYGSDAMYYGVDSYGIATALYNAGYRKQSEVIEKYRQKVNVKMGKHTHLLGKEYVQRILREVAKEMKGGEE